MVTVSQVMNLISILLSDFYIKLGRQIKIASGELIHDRSSSEADLSVTALIIAKGTRREPRRPARHAATPLRRLAASPPRHHAKINGLLDVMTLMTAVRSCT